MTIQPIAGQADGPEPADAVPVRTEATGDDYVRVALDAAELRQHEALSTWAAMCRVEQMLRDRRGS